MNRILVNILKNGGVGVLPTDTIYGIVGSALQRGVVERIYRLRKRNKKKPMIILIGSLTDLRKFNIKIDRKTKELFKRFWPGKVSILMPCPHNKFTYLHRGTKQLAFRFPKPKILQNLLKHTGPLVAPSANFEAEPYAKTISEAWNYFGNAVDFYIDVGRLVSKPSTLIKIENDKIAVLRCGAVHIK